MAKSMLEKFFFDTPLYSEIESDDIHFVATLFEVRRLESPSPLTGIEAIDGWCCYCKAPSVFRVQKCRNESHKPHEQKIFHSLLTENNIYICYTVCTRSSFHRYSFIILQNKKCFQKFGQTPSLADVANDESKVYNKLLDPQDAQELHKAIGLAAHGVGVGAFVYVRRVFERLVWKRFDEFAEKEGWQREVFVNLRMNEKIGMLSGYLPSFIFENREFYSVLSKGVHELDEKVCIELFPAIRSAIKFILEEDKKKKEELRMRNEAAEALRKAHQAETKGL